MTIKALSVALLLLFSLQIPVWGASPAAGAPAANKVRDQRPVYDDAYDSVALGTAALASLFFLPFVCTFVLGITALAVGIHARKQILRHPSEYRGKGWADAGIILGISAFSAAAIAIMLAAKAVHQGFRQLFKRKKKDK